MAITVKTMRRLLAHEADSKNPRHLRRKLVIKTGQPVWWGLGFFFLATVALLVVVLSRLGSIDRQFTEPGIADYRNGNYPKAIQELNTAIKLDQGNSYAYYYLGLSLKKTGDAFHARRAFLNAKSCERNSRNSNPDFIDRCDKAMNDIDDGH